MGESTGIEWAHHTFNPWWGCTRVSPGCDHCYAETWAKRSGVGWGDGAARRLFGPEHWRAPLKWDRAAAAAGERRRVFCASMGDVNDPAPELEPERVKLWALIRETRNLDWLLLTKRPELARRFLPWAQPARSSPPWPNVWLGVTAEDQTRADLRLPLLRMLPAVRRFVSYEPALELVDFARHLHCESCGYTPRDRDQEGDHHLCHGIPGWLDWIIAGGESGHGARPAELGWYRAVRDQCAAAGVSFFLKQHVLEGGRKKISLPVLDGRQHVDVPAAEVQRWC